MSSPKVVLAPNVVQRLAQAKFELALGLGELEAHSERGAYKAIKTFHDALDLFVAALGLHVALPPDRRFLIQYPKALKDHTGVAFQHADVLYAVNEFRNPAKHGGLFPSVDSVRDVASRIGTVFEENSQAYLGMSFREVRLATAIKHDQARDEITAAEDAIEARKYAEALGLLRVAFEVFLSDLDRPLPQDLIVPTLERRAAGAGLDVEAQSINWAWRYVSTRIALVDLGINLLAHSRFMAVTPSVFIPGDTRRRTINYLPWIDLVSTEENASFALGFVVETICNIEAAVRTRHHQSLFKIRAKVQTPCYAWDASGELEVVRTLLPGEIVDELASFGLGGKGQPKIIFSWGPDDNRVAAAFDSFEIIDEITLAEQGRRRRDELLRQR